MIELNIIGVTSVSDLYPNVKYKIPLIASLPNVAASTTIYDLENTGHYKTYSNKNPFKKLFSLLRYCWGTLKVFFSTIKHNKPNVYICYPGVFLSLLFSFIPRSRRPFIFYDAFISIYDTAINDRSLYTPDSFMARLLYWAECRAFKTSDRIITDTEENADFYAELYRQSKNKFDVIHLCIPPLEQQTKAEYTDDNFNCLFIGSFVPLHGIQYILEAVTHLQEKKNIRFKFIGEGQEAYLLDDFLKKHPQSTLTWDKGFYSTTYLSQQISKADLCLGIFGNTQKTDRVIPYKVYYYAATGKAFITRSSSSFRRINQELDIPLSLDAGHDARELASLIERFVNDSELRMRQEKASSDFYHQHLSEAAIQNKLSNVLSSHARTKTS
jgi:glycosyltransferase involved in cell wall biosynthesis